MRSRPGDEVEKDTLCEKIFYSLQAEHGVLTGKIVGMLAEVEMSELRLLPSNTFALQSKVTEALHVLADPAIAVSQTEPLETKKQQSSPMHAKSAEPQSKPRACPAAMDQPLVSSRDGPSDEVLSVSGNLERTASVVGNS